VADPDPPRVAIVGERVEMPARRAAEHGDQVALGERRHLPDHRQPAGVQLAGRDRPDAPQPLDRQWVQELQLLPGGDDQQPVRLRDRAGDLGEVLGRRHADGDRQPTSSRTRMRNRSAICSGEPAIRRMPRTSRNASSIEMPSTSGVVSLKISNTALLASE
jgi:hypothetical protein